MQTLTQPTNKPLSEVEARQAEASSIALQHLLGKDDQPLQQVTLRVSIERPDGEKAEILLPGATLSLLSKILRELGHGKNVVALATDTEVTTQQAADFLKVSRPYVVKLLEEGKIPYRLVGPRRRVSLGDLLHYKEQEETERHRGLNELVAEAQKLGMY
ncbi:MAG: excisionase family DNA-binding protein [Armatimonadetes bacterium]|nr:excisionase family DNA-binding protein [Armatimonadota bacterium]